MLGQGVFPFPFVNPCIKLQTLVYDVFLQLPDIFPGMSGNGQFLAGAQMAVSL